MMDQVIDAFNFERVHLAMTAIDWQWQTTRNNGLEVPSIPTLKARARYLLTEATKEEVISSGGLTAKYHHSDNKDQSYYTLQFILCETDSCND